MHDPYKPHPLWGSTPPIILGRKVLQRVSPAEYPVRTDPIYGCWRWEGPLTGGGYSSLRLDSGTVVGHRHLYELVWGPIPDGYVIDHLCRRPSCVRPVHLEAVTKGENFAFFMPPRCAVALAEPTTSRLKNPTSPPMPT